jgi:hypothetical protein
MQYVEGEEKSPTAAPAVLPPRTVRQGVLRLEPSADLQAALVVDAGGVTPRRRDSSAGIAPQDDKSVMHRQRGFLSDGWIMLAFCSVLIAAACFALLVLLT